MKILKRFSLLCIILILSQSIHNSIQQNDDVPDDQLDPLDIKDYELEKKAEKLSTTTTTTTTTESTTTTTELTTTASESSSTTTTEEETSPETTTKSEETSTRVSTISSSTSTKATTAAVVEDVITTSTSSQLRVNEQGFIDFEVKSGQYQEIVVVKAASTDPNSLSIYSIRSPLALLNNYQIQLHVDTDAHIDFRSCAISISTSKNITSSENEECIRSYIEIIDSARFSLRIKRDQLPNTVRIKLRTVISGCDAESKLRDISLASSTSVPSIYHNSDHECIYRVVNPNSARTSMMKLLVESFPMSEDKVCHAIVEIANGDSSEAIDSHDHRLQARFDSLESIEPFAAGVLVAAKYAFIKVVNCYENNEPVEISIGVIRKASFGINLNEKQRAFRLDSDTVASPAKDSFLVGEIRNENLRNLIDYNLEYILDAKKDCTKLDRNTSMLTVYGMDDLDNMQVFQYYPCSTTPDAVAPHQQELNGFKTLYVQFYRETKNPRSGLAADKFVLTFNLKVVQTKHIFLTNRASHVSSADFENLDLRNIYFDFEIRAPLGHRIVLNVSKFDNGKSTPSMGHGCDDFLLVRLNKTTNRMKSFYETSHNPIFCSSIGTQPVLLSSYTNTLTVSVYLKKLDDGALNEHFIDIPHFEFSYTTEPFCNNMYTKRQNALIGFSSLQSMPADSNGQCSNTISVGVDRKVVLYKLDWLEYNLNGNAQLESDETNLNFVNGRLVCNGSDSLIISDENPKYSIRKSVEDDPNYIYNIYCMANPFRSYISDSSRLFMIYKLHQSPHKPLVFDLGYFSYKFLYTDFDSRVDIDFSKIIPSNVLKRTVVSNLDVIIRLDNKTNYIVPVISECDFGGGLETGDIVLKTSSRSIPIKNLKCGASEDGERTAVSYTTMLSMENELRVEFKNVRLSELRDKKVRFRIDYKSEPRVFESNAGTFETNNFKHDYVSITRDRVEYEWTIKVSVNDMIRLRVDDLLNEAGVTEWTITDLNENVRYYDQNELIENFKSKRDFTYLIPTNWIKITFKHDRDGNKRRSTSTYPYLRLSYVSEPRIITQDSTTLNSQRQELRLSNSLVKRRVEWVIVGARDHHIVAEITRFSSASKDSNGQIKFSLLGRGYTDNGTYHFNLNERRDVETRDRVTDLVVSASNALRIEYMPGQAGDSFTIAYRALPQVHQEPSGWIRQYFNEITKPEIFVPRLTDQSWLIRAPYSKKIALYVKSMDLLNESPCSKSRVDFFEANGTRVFSECGNMEHPVFELQHSLALVTGSNELSIQFLTQNTNEVVYSGRIEEGVRAHGSDPLDTPADGDNYHTYRGFLYFYAFLEQSGDCYFQQRGRNLMCGYESVGGPKWLIAGDEDDVESKSVEQVEFDKIFCSNCYLSAQIPVQSEAGSMAETASILVSPVISKHSVVLKFDYRMFSNADLLVILIHNHDYKDKKFDRSVLIKKIDKVTEGNSWSTVRLRLGTHIMHNFRILFSLEKTSNSSSPPTVNLDNIEFFEQDYECAVRMDDDETCAAGSSLFSSLKSQQSMKPPVNEVCQKYATPCELSECQNGALCLNKYQIEANLFVKMATNQNEDDDEYICICPYGFTGKKCETRIDPCESNECSPNSRCVGALGELERGYRCECNASFTGELCDERLSACKLLENPCNEKTEQGTCLDVGVNEHRCECTPFYTGANCETLLNKHCVNDECRKFDVNATCIELTDQSYCRCSPGFSGPTCTNIDDCKDVPCLNNGTCIDGVNSFVCQCTEAFEGKYCELSKKCADCKQPGTLYCKPNEARCVCRATHAGEHCEVELDPCLDKPCGKNGECSSDKVENYQCLCHPGFKGKNCELEENICDLGLCQNGATCMLSQDLNDFEHIGYECQCAPGFEGKNCELLINMCEKDGGCANGGTCLPTPVGNFTCLCPVSHTGRTCEQLVDHCLTAKCAYGSTCHIRLNSYICECPPGRFGRYCDEEQDPCLNNECKNGFCVPHELQPDGTHPYTCQCQPGYTGEHCEVEIDDCESSPCENNSTCVDLVGTYKCICPYNYRGKNCENRFELCSQPETRCDLKNTKQCIPIPNGIKCDCMPRFTGLRCETPISFCEAFKPCRSGRCVQLEGDEYECKDCVDGYGGKNCSELINYCEQLTPCKNGGVCYAKPNDYFCHCSEKFMGKNCELKVHPECIHNRCMHNSVCMPDRDSKRGYRCECGESHEGDYCEKKKDKCRDVDCSESGGYCVDGKCECDPKHPLCASECKKKNVVCMNGGKCVDVIKGSGIDAVCMCPPGLTGEFCEHSIFCVSNGMRPCGKNSQCKTVNQSYECHCEHPYIGHGCSIKLNDYFPEYENYMNQVRLSAQNEKCRFGRSKESKILIGIIAVGGFTLLIIGLMIGHCSIIAYRKRYEAASSLNKVPNKGTYSAMSSENSSTKSGFLPKTPIRALSPREMNLNKSSAFSIPRPSVRL